jgi:HSP20 family protein
MFARLNSFENNLFHEFSHMEREMERLLNAVGLTNTVRHAKSVGYPPINIATTPKQVDVYVFAAGIETESLDISINRNLLTVEGKRPLNRKQELGYFRKERFDGDFRHTVNLPDDADNDKVEASYQNGVLHIVVPRREAPEPHRITVQ